MKIYATVFTRDKNKPFFNIFYKSYQVCANYLLNKMPQTEIDLVVMDFSEEFNDQPERYGDLLWEFRSNAGFCSNFNYARMDAINARSSYFFCFNDDIALSESFLYNAIQTMNEDREIGFCGGHSQIGGWLEDIENIKIPTPIDKYTHIRSISRLNWEFSAMGLPTEVLKEVGFIDELFSPQIGLVCDNDYLHRIRRLGLKTIHNYACTFWHSKARSQSELRDPWGRDPHMIRAAQVMLLKWNAGLMPDVDYELFVEPWNGKRLEIFDQNTILLDGETIKLEAV